MKKMGKALVSLMLSAAMLGTNFCGVVPAAAEEAKAVMPTRAEVIEALERVNDHWISTHSNPGNAFWHPAAYQVGNMEAYFTTGIEDYRKYAELWAAKNAWQGAKSTNKAEWRYDYGENDKHVLFGDWQICFQTYIDLYNIEVNEKKGAPGDYTKIARAKEVMEYQMSTDRKDYWWWADGLFMVMPVMTKLYHLTGDEQYLDKLTEYFKYAKDEIPSQGNDGTFGMWDDEYKLFHRDAKYKYPYHKTDNGKKDFWARGSGWVFAGLAKVLSDMPTGYKNRDYFLETYKQMAEGVIALQQPEGYWSRSMADLAHAPGMESSGTAFFTYGLAWGINSGYLEKEKFLEPCLKGWYFLYNTALQEDGTVGYVQPIGENSKQSLNIGERNSSDFGVGAFLLAASEISKLAGGVEGDIYPYLQKKMVGSIALELNSPHIYKNGRIYHIDESNHEIKVYTKDGRAMVPVRGVAEMLGATVQYNDATQEVTVTRRIINGNNTRDRVVKLTVGSTDYTVDGEAKTLDVAAEVVNGRTFIPLRAMAEAIGMQVYYSDYTGNEGLGGLIVIGHKADPFFECDTNAVELLRKMIGPNENYPTRPKQPEKNLNIQTFVPSNISNTAVGTKINLTTSMIKASAEPEPQNSAANAIDGNPGTFWAAEGDQTFIIDLGKSVPLTSICVRMRQYDDQRTVSYDVSISEDNSKWTTIFSGSCPPSGGVPEYHNTNANARYVRIGVHGNTVSNWASVAEIEVYTSDGSIANTLQSGAQNTTATPKTVTGGISSTPTGTKVKITTSMIKASAEPEPHNSAENAIDGDPSTFWAAEGDQNFVIDLGSSKTISCVGVRMRKYDDTRTVRYDVSISEDNKTWITLFSGSCPESGGVWEYHSANANARYVKIDVHGNTVSNWASVAEIEVYTSN